MNTISKLLSLVLVLVLTISLVACGNATESETVTQTPTTVENVQETEQVTEEPTQDEIDYDNLVIDAVYEELKDPFSSQVCYYHIPKINLSDGSADEINKKMLSDGEDFIADANESIDANVSIIAAGYNYLWGSKGDVVSVLTARFYNMPGLDYSTYNLNMKTGEILSNDDLSELFGLSQQELSDLLIKKAAEKFEEEYAAIKEQASDFYDMQYQNTISQKNAEQSLLYINRDGDLCSVITIYSLAGAQSYDHVINLTGDTPAKDPDVMS